MGIHLNLRPSEKLSSSIKSCWWAALLLAIVAPADSAESSREILEGLHENVVTRIGPHTEIGGRTIYQIKKDSQGFLWVATIFRVYRYDGSEFVDYTADFDRDPHLQEKLVYHMINDSKGDLWIGTNLGLFRYDRELDQIRKEMDTNRILRLVEDPFGRIWTFDRFGGLRIFERGETGLREVSLTGLGDQALSSVSFAGKGSGWLIGRNGELFELELDDRTIRASPSRIAPFKGRQSYVASQSLLVEGSLWVGTDRTGLIRYDLESGRSRNYRRQGEKGPHAIEGNRISWLKRDHAGRLWAGLYDGGANLYLQEEDRFQRFSFVRGHLVEEGRAAPLCAEFSDDGLGWFGTSDLGMFCFDSAKGPFRYESLLARRIDFSVAGVDSYLRTRDGTQWVLVKYNGLYRKSENRFLETDIFPCSSVRSSYFMAEDRFGRIWTNTRDGVLVVDPKDKSCVSLEIEGFRGMIRGDVLSVGEEMWVGLGDHILRFHVESMSQVGVLEGFEGSIRHFHLDEQERIWIGARRALYVYDLPNERFFESEHGGQPDKRIIYGHWVTGVETTEDGGAWISSYGEGIRRLDADFQIIDKLEARDGLPSEAVGAMQSDESGRLWLATREGLVTFCPKERSVRHYVEKDGLLDNRFDQRVSSKEDDGALVFLGKKGILRVYPELVATRLPELEPHFTSIKVLGEAVAIGSEDSALQRSILVADDLRLRHDESVVSLSYTGFNYKRQGITWFRHRILGAKDESWSEPTLERSADLLNLESGEYTFELQATSDSRYWEGPTRVLNIVVEPSVWERWWARLALVIVFLFAVYLASVIRTRNINRRRQVLEGLVRERTRTIDDRNAEILAQNEELERHRHHLEGMVAERTKDLNAAKERAEESSRLKSSFLANLSHEIRTPLNALVGISQLLMLGKRDDHDDSVGYSKIIEENANGLARLVEDILDLAKLESDQMGIEVSRFDLKALCSELGKDLSKRIEKSEKRIRFAFASEEEGQLFVRSDEVHVRRILWSIFENAHKFTKQGSITISLERENDWAVVSVVDTGIGIHRENHQEIFKRFWKYEEFADELYRGAGLGLAIGSKLAKLIGAKIKLVSKPDEGSRFDIWIPIDGAGLDSTGRGSDVL